jgi:flagellar basal body-associated protein FliL
VRNFLKGLFVLVLIAIIVGGLGYIGYSYYFLNNNSNMSMYSNDIASTNNNPANNAGTMQDGMQMQQGSMAMQNQQGNTMVINTVKDILNNKQSLDNAIAAFKDSLSSLTLDPYSPSGGLNNISNGTSPTGSMNGMQMLSGTTMPNATIPTNTTTPLDTSANDVNGSTTINILPENNNTANLQATSVLDMSMKDMGTSYDTNKMEQLHTGLYKLSVGMQLLEQLNNKFLAQAEAVRTANTDYPIEYYSNLYTQVFQNKSKLNQALNYINEASNMVNINPYVSNNGLVYDKDRMLSIHQSVFKMAKGVALTTELNDELVNQAIDASVDAQNALNNSNMNVLTNNMNQSNMTSQNGILGNLGLPSIFNILIIAFVVLFVFGLLGAIFSLFKTPQQKTKS